MYQKDNICTSIFIKARNKVEFVSRTILHPMISPRFIGGWSGIIERVHLSLAMLLNNLLLTLWRNLLYVLRGARFEDTSNLFRAMDSGAYLFSFKF